MPRFNKAEADEDLERFLREHGFRWVDDCFVEDVNGVWHDPDAFAAHEIVFEVGGIWWFEFEWALGGGHADDPPYCGPFASEEDAWAAYERLEEAAEEAPVEKGLRSLLWTPRSWG